MFNEMPLFFKLWFAFIICVIILTFSTAGYVIYSAISGPEVVGQFFGRIVSGFEKEVGKK